MYSLAPGKPPHKALKKVALSQFTKAVQEATLPDAQEATHQIRKRGKKTRALMRLFRYTDARTEALYQCENASIRSINTLLSANRDAVSLYEALAEQLGAERFPHTATYLHSRAQCHQDRELHEAGKLLRRSKRHIEDWEILHLQWEDLQKGYKKSYRKTTKALRKAQACDSDQNFHQLRKRVKDQWYHSRLLKDRYPDTIGRRCKPLKRLASYLGHWRDLRLLCHFLALNSGSLDREASTELIPLLDQAQQRLQELRGEIDHLCGKLFPRKKWSFD